MVYATHRQHKRVREYLDRVQNATRRQVLIEATVVEVTLNDQSQSGVDWRWLSAGAGFSSGTNFLGISPSDTQTFQNGIFPLTGDERGVTIGYGNRRNFAAALKLLSQYGRVKVLSSPKISTLNNQPAILRVVDNLVYFSVTAQTTQSQTGPAITTYNTTPATVAVGFTMSVTPQVDESSTVTLWVRPTITRIKGYSRDPNPALTLVPNLVPIVQTREIDSVMKMPSGAVAMMGGLMEDVETRQREGLPVASEFQGLGTLFGVKNSQVAKTELVIFLRPVVIEDPSVNGDYAFSKTSMPHDDFFNQPSEKELPLQPIVPLMRSEQ